MGRRRRKSRGKLGLLLLVLAMAAAAAYAYAYAQQAEPRAPPMRAAPAGTLRVHYVDVGQGDATVWEMPDGSLVLYDCGPPARDAQSNRLVRYLRDTLGRAPGSRIDALIASHGHLDHIGGCEEVFTTYEVAEVFEAWYEGADAPASYRRLLAEVEAEGARVRTLADLRVGAPLDRRHHGLGGRAQAREAAELLRDGEERLVV
ncbi:MAG TPA: MBL fold metallo-hydrolase, partial [Candidatus Thermoplasmatota archaeon]|nr:MBL fold metallo-hydrolase [Candidatus Thermoplasmatota archaeon]